MARDWDTIDCRELAVRCVDQPVWKASRAGPWFCPFYAGHKTPSLTVYPNGYQCFGCSAHGSTVDLGMTPERMDFQAAVQQLSAMFAATPARRPWPAQRKERVAGIETWHLAGWQAAACRP